MKGERQYPVRRRDPPRKASYYRIPETGPVTPRLRDGFRTEAIGFVHDYINRKDSEGEDRES